MIFELNVRVYGKPFNEITDLELQTWADLGFDWLWLMGIWRISPAGRLISKQMAADYEGSPYALLDYTINPDLGGETAFQDLVTRAHKVGLKVMADFIPNHMAVDSPLIYEQPDYFIHSNPGLRNERPRDYFMHGSGRYLAHGRDPYFAGWEDTVQLDYVNPDLRAHQIKILERLAGLVDGLRCDMAMLILRDQIKSQWFPNADQAAFDMFMPNEFWPEAIGAVKKLRPDFIFMAEVYWDKEQYLQELGFDLTYDKKFYDLLLAGKPENVVSYLQTTPNYYLAHTVHFLENHDEHRAAAQFGSRAIACAVLSYSILGMPFVYQGQMEGFQEKLPVQRLHPLHKEVADENLAKVYQHLLSIIRDPLFRQGEMLTLGLQQGVILVRRRYEGRTILIGADIVNAPQNGSKVILDIATSSLALPAEKSLKCLDLWSGERITEISCDNGHLNIPLASLPSWGQTAAFLIELFVEP